ncbi:MAG TPA: M15 family metallopeptidase [Caulobacterales bacterium]|nr:M15 family metallopeptidase [Caulobacterales bacterium]
MKQGYRDWPIDQSGAMYTEKLAHAHTFGLAGRNYYAHSRNPPYWAPADGAIDALLVRHSVGVLLQEIDARLKREGLKLSLFDAWRPRAVQAYFHDVWMPHELRRRRPDLSEDEIKTEVLRYWAAPTIDPMRPAPHATGGAVDLTIVWEDGEPLYMGSLFDDVTALAGTDRFERDQNEPSFSHDEARANRRLLYWLMIEAGFSNHPDEWWHYSYGDQMWAIHMGKPAALYGLAEPEPGLIEADNP